jgi:hypothetical protein
VVTASCGKHLGFYVYLRPKTWLRMILSAFLVFGLLYSRPSQAQSTEGIGVQADGPSSVHGRVLNRATHEPISRALVFSPDQRYATLTDHLGRFEFKFPPQVPAPKGDVPSSTDADGLRNAYRAQQLRMLQNARPETFLARKPGFLQNASNPSSGRVAANQSELVIYLDPEALVVGRVNLPGAEGDMRIRTDLYRREIREGQEHWELARTFTTWADGEFRFCDLSPGTYKLGTGEQLDRDPLIFSPEGQLFGFPPIFYTGASDFSVAGSIQLASGGTFQASLSPQRREYYPVKIPVGNAAAQQPMSIRIYPLGRPGPGYSLGYNSAEQLIQGTLPDGSYTLEADTQGRPGSTGFLNFSIRGGPRDGPALNLVPNSSLAVTVREEFKSGQSVFEEGPAAPDDGTSNTPPRRRVNVQVMLMSVEEFGSAATAVSEPAQGMQEHALVIPNVRPGRYRVHVQTAVGFAASIVSGGTDLLRQPLVIGLGGLSSPIEITLRDDGAEVDGKVEDATEGHIYFLPVGEGSGEFREANCTFDGSFALAQLPPGTYRVLAFDSQQNDLAYADPEALRKLESKGQIIHLDAGQKEHLRLKIIPGGDSQ